MFINYELKSIFFHIPKCGGSTVVNIINKLFFNESCTTNHENYINFVDDESYIKDIKYKHTIRKLGKYRYFYSHQHANKEHMDTFFKFIFVRNPYTKLLSAYLYLKRKLNETNNNTIRGLEENPEYFTDFNVFVKNHKNVNNISFCHAFICQHDHILDFSNNIRFEYIGKSESLNNDLIDILTLLDIKSYENILYNKSQNISNYEKEITEYYNEETFYFVNEFFEKDFEIFSYKKYDTFEEFKQNFNNYQNIIINKDESQIKNISKIPDYFIKIPSKYEKIKYCTESQLIPKNIIQTYKHNFLHPDIHNNIKKILQKNPTYDYYFITDEDGIKLIEEHFDSNTLNAFKKLKLGAAKGDFIRYIALYIYGGVYLDLDAGIEIDLDEFIPKNNEYLFIYDSSKSQITNWCMMITPRHIVIKNIIDEMVKRIHQRNEINILIVTGPGLITDVIYNFFNKSNIYNLVANLKHDLFLKFIIENNNPPIFFDAFYVSCLYNIIKFRFKGYNDIMIYYNEIKYYDIDEFNIYCENNKKSIETETKYDIIQNYYKLNIYNEIIDKYKKISNLLIDEVIKRCHYKMNDINTIKNEITNIEKIYMENKEENEIIKKNIIEILIKEKKEKLSKNIKYCEKCGFKSYNTTAYNAHSYFCK